MLRICPRYCLSCSNAARQTLKVPFKSMSTTVPKPFEESSSALQRKFPAAPFTTMSTRPSRIPFLNIESIGLPAGNERPRLHNIDLSAHERPFDVLFFGVKFLFDFGRGFGQTPDGVISQHHAIGANRNLSDAAIVVE